MRPPSAQARVSLWRCVRAVLSRARSAPTAHLARCTAATHSCSFATRPAAAPARRRDGWLAPERGELRPGVRGGKGDPSRGSGGGPAMAGLPVSCVTQLLRSSHAARRQSTRRSHAAACWLRVGDVGQRHHTAQLGSQPIGIARPGFPRQPASGAVTIRGLSPSGDNAPSPVLAARAGDQRRLGAPLPTPAALSAAPSPRLRLGSAAALRSLWGPCAGCWRPTSLRIRSASPLLPLRLRRRRRGPQLQLGWFGVVRGAQRPVLGAAGVRSVGSGCAALCVLPVSCCITHAYLPFFCLFDLSERMYSCHN